VESKNIKSALIEKAFTQNWIRFPGEKCGGGQRHGQRDSRGFHRKLLKGEGHEKK